MSTVELVLTDNRIWAVGPATHWDLPPSVVLGSDGALVVGESLQPPTQVSSAVQFVPAERIALLPRVPTVVEALSAVGATILENLGIALPAARVVVICPTEWGSRRRGMVAEALGPFVAEVEFEETAVRAVLGDEESARARRAVVLEFGTVSTTATSVAMGAHGHRIESCEFEPTLAGSDPGVDPAAPRTLSALLDRLLAGRPADVVQILGISDRDALDVVCAELERLLGPETRIRARSGGDLVRPAQPEPRFQPSPTAALPTPEWMQPLRQRATAQQDPGQRRTVYLVGGAVAVAVVIAVAIGAVVALGGSDAEQTAAPATTSAVAPTTASPSSSASGAPTPAGPTPEAFGRIRFQIPDGWQRRAGTDEARMELSPSDGARLRITLTQTTVDRNAGYDQIAANLEAQMAQKPTISDLRRDVVFGGRSMLAYVEKPQGGSTVNWHVLVEHGTQVSIGCQYVGDGWEALAATCDKFAASVHVLPA